MDNPEEKCEKFYTLKSHNKEVLKKKSKGEFSKRILKRVIFKYSKF